MRIESFLPSRHGFAFASTIALDEPRFGLAVPVSPAFGLSAGMAWAALDRYHGGRPVPPHGELPTTGDPLHAELLQRQAAALARAGWAELRTWQSMPEHGWPWRPGLADRTRTEWHRLRRRLDAGNPVMLYLVMARGRHADPSCNQAVLAYGYEVDRRGGRVSLRVYDPARPRNDGVRLVFRLGSHLRPLDARLAVKTAVRGFFCVPYDRPTPARLVRSDAGTLDTRAAATILSTLGTPRPEGPLTVLARSGEGRLLQIRRARRARWSVAPIELAGKGAAAPVEDAIALAPGHLVLRTSAGELIEARRRPPLGWRTRSISGKAVKAAFDAPPAVLRDPRGALDVFACRGGRLLHFRRSNLGGWKTRHVKAGPLARVACAGAPAAVCMSHGVLHVVVRTEAGELIHARWRGKQGWSAENVTARTGDRTRFLVVDDPILLVDRTGARLSAVGRSSSGAVLLFCWTQRSGWRGRDLTGFAGAEPSLRTDSVVSAALDGEGTVHACARTSAQGLLHTWCTRDGATGAADVTHSRRAIGAGGEIDGHPRVFATPDGGLLVLARQGLQLLLFRWDAAADWSLENVSAEHGAPALPADPLIAVAQATLHATGLDDAGRLHHVALASPAAGGRGRMLLNLLADVTVLPLSAALLVADLALLPVRGIARAVALLHGRGTEQREATRAEGNERMSARLGDTVATPRPLPSRLAAPEQFDELPTLEDSAPAALSVLGDEMLHHPPDLDAAADGYVVEVPPLDVDDAEDAPLELPRLEIEDTEDASVALPGLEIEDAQDASVPLPRLEIDDAEDASVPLPRLEIEDGEDAPVELPRLEIDDSAEIVEEMAPTAEDPDPFLDIAAAAPPTEREAATQPEKGLPLLDGASEEQSTAGAIDAWDEAAQDQAALDGTSHVRQPQDVEPAEPVGSDPPELPLLEPAPDEESWLEPWAAAPGAVPPVPDVTAEPWSESKPDADPWSPPEPVGEVWNAPAEPLDPWLLTPLESEPWMASPSCPNEAAPAPPDATVEQTASQETRDTPELPEPAPDVDEWSMPAPSASTCDDWNMPPAAPEEASLKAASEAIPQPPETDDWNFPPVESNSTSPAESAERPRKWVNPALEGLPLLDDDEPRAPAAAPPTVPHPPPSKPTADPAEKGKNGKKKKTKKAAAQDELQRVMALADQNRPELLPPS